MRNKLIMAYIRRNGRIASYLMKLVELRDNLGAVGGEVKDYELVQIASIGFRSPWYNFV